MSVGLVALSLLGFAGFLGAEPLAGRVVGIEEATRVVLVQPRGLSAEAGPLRLVVGEGDWKVGWEGREIRGDQVEVGGVMRLQKIWPDDAHGWATIERLGALLKQDSMIRGSKIFRHVGEPMPRFALWDQNGRLFLSESLKGHYAVIHFVFTRCPVPTMCPAATQRFFKLQRELEATGLVQVVKLVSLTLDPDFDTPGVCKAYLASYGGESENMVMLTGPERVLEDLRKQLGVLSEPDPVQIVKHTASTALVDPLGRILYRVPGSSWETGSFVRQIQKHRASLIEEAKVLPAGEVETLPQPEAEAPPTGAGS